VEQEPDPLKELRRQLKLDTQPERSPSPTLVPVTRTRIDDGDRRRLLWRDSATILIGLVLALIAGQVLIPAPTAGPIGSPTAEPSLIAIGSFGPPPSVAPGATFGPIVNASLGVDATPTPIPVITLGPSPSPSPSASPSVRPSGSVKPSAKPSPKPTVKPTPKPTKPTPTPTPAPEPPAAQFTPGAITINAGETVDFTDTSTGQIDAWSWSFGDGGTSAARNPSHQFLAPCDVFENTCAVRLTVTGPTGTDFREHTVTVIVP